jgi:beta-mannanase
MSISARTLAPLSTLMLCASAQALQIGAWVGGSGQYPQPGKENVEAFQAKQGRKLDLISVFALWGVNDWAWTRTYADIAQDNGSTLLVTWMPNGYPAPAIVSGAADPYIRKYATDVKQYGKEIWLRPLHEANGDWYDWGIAKAGAGNTPANLTEAWKHIVSIFREEGVANVKWVWTTNATNSGAATFTGAYPGDAWVDYNSIDGYNWGSSQTWSSWQSFEQVFSPAYAALEKFPKPLFIAEFSSTEHGGDKAAWIRDMFTVLPAKFPKINALMWFSQSKSAEADWAVDTSPAALAAWKAGIASAPSAFSASPDYPAPTRSVRSLAAGLEIVLGAAEDVEAAFYDAKGKMLESRRFGRLPAGTHLISLPVWTKSAFSRMTIGGEVYEAVTSTPGGKRP